MTHRTRLTVAAAAAFLTTLVAAAAPAGALTVGDPAPPLKVGKWVKGEPVTQFENGKLYVVEFWATWCGPCKQTIPHLTELQKKNKDVIFIGQDVSEQDDSAVEPFVKEMGEKMDYRVATDDKSSNPAGVMSTTWMQAANQDGIPTAFIVNKEGKIAWIGHPMTMEEPLSQIVAGKYDLETAKKEAQAKQAEAQAMQAVQQELMTKVGPAVQKQDFAAAATAIDEIIAGHPETKKQLLRVKFLLLAQAKQFDKAYLASDELFEAAKDDKVELNQMAWAIATGPQFTQRDLDRAMKYAQRAVEISQQKDADPMDTLARIYADKGDVAKAIEWQTKAIAAAGEDSPNASAMKQTLEGYKAKQK